MSQSFLAFDKARTEWFQNPDLKRLMNRLFEDRRCMEALAYAVAHAARVLSNKGHFGPSTTYMGEVLVKCVSSALYDLMMERAKEIENENE